MVFIQSGRIFTVRRTPVMGPVLGVVLMPDSSVLSLDPLAPISELEWPGHSGPLRLRLYRLGIGSALLVLLLMTQLAALFEHTAQVILLRVGNVERPGQQQEDKKEKVAHVRSG